MKAKKYWTKKRKNKFKNTVITVSKMTAIALVTFGLIVTALTFAPGARAASAGQFIIDPNEPPVYSDNFNYDGHTRTGSVFIYR